MALHCIMSEFFDSDEEIKKGRHNLPHWHQDNTWVFLTWRLADSLPKDKLDEWKQLKAAFHHHHPQPWDKKTHIAYRKLITDDIEDWLDKGHGECLLKNAGPRKIVEDAFHFFQNERYDMQAFVIMPNHVHLLMRTIAPYQLENIMHSLKSFTANKINGLAGRRGALWQSEYYDRLIRTPEHFEWAIRYIENNPAQLYPSHLTLWKES